MIWYRSNILMPDYCLPFTFSFVYVATFASISDTEVTNYKEQGVT